MLSSYIIYANFINKVVSKGYNIEISYNVMIISTDTDQHITLQNHHCFNILAFNSILLIINIYKIKGITLGPFY